MKAEFVLFFRQHHSGWYTATVLDHGEYGAYGQYPSVLRTELTDALGQVTGTMQYIDNQEYIVKVRKGTSSPLYSPAQGAGVIGSAGLDTTVLLVGDE